MALVVVVRERGGAMGGRLGVHLIVRNEENRLPRCLDSVQGLADEIIVVDTGSTDRTVELARSRGAVVKAAPWTDSFADARNAGLPLASTEWILVLDADESVEGGADLLAEALDRADPQTNAFRVKMTHRIGDRAEDAVVSEAVRLFRAGRGFRYEGRIHEQLLVPGPDGSWECPAGENSPLRLIHTGYLPGELSRKETAQRNRRLLMLELGEKPGDPFLLYNLGVSYCQSGELAEAERAFVEALSKAPEKAPYRATLVRDTVKLWLAGSERNGERGTERRGRNGKGEAEWQRRNSGSGGQRRMYPDKAPDKVSDLERERARELARERAMGLLQAELPRYSDYAELHHLLGECLEEEGLLGEAFDSFAKACECGGGETGDYVAELGAGRFVSRASQARMALRLGAPQLAEELYRAALAECPSYRPAVSGWAEALSAIGVPDRDLRELLLARIGSEGSAADRLLVARALVRCGADEEAIGLLRELGAEELPASLIRAGRYREAMERLREQENAGGHLPALVQADAAIACWAEGVAPSEELLRGLPRDMRDDAAALTAALLGANPENSDLRGPGGLLDLRDLRDRALPARIMERMLELRLPRLAEKLAERIPNGEQTLAASLYRHGYALRAADRFIRLMSAGQLDEEGCFQLAEILCERGHYASAAALFERAAEKKGAWREARWGAAFCYLQLARQTAAEGAERFPEAEGLRSDLVKIDQAIGELNRIEWRTSRLPAARRNSHA
ncbi:glycosyltransferase [Cohnella sp. AR92]|uniref:glycosyltransferase n=1 Tax=Cohnella sp. AR92 TaxID=648716 RepID=UPI000F8DE4ED|nr:glycosyltransferase [Cohnella sp. AR92]RUS49110.1 glycosyltransferase [Cohnella sp. AR92]